MSESMKVFRTSNPKSRRTSNRLKLIQQRQQLHDEIQELRVMFNFNPRPWDRETDFYRASVRRDSKIDAAQHPHLYFQF